MASRRDDPTPIEAEIVEAEPTQDDSSGEPPVVARLVVEIRSDGRRTIARGAMEDVKTGQKVAVEARGSSPLGLAVALARSMVRAPAFARTAARALLPRRSRR